ncbi:MAG: PQQ-dependent sugar dehydrogenase [Xanthomonadales bacterium]|nr:PQQ-dependent sugar dehydrogenase [Xanthomonadales bacterium]
MSYQTKIFLSVFMWAMWPVLALAEQVVLTPVMDTTLYEDDEGDLGNGAGEYLFFGKVGSTQLGAEKLRRALVKFDLSAIPSVAVIDSVSLAFAINQVPMVTPAGGNASLHRVTASWGEGASDANGNEGQGAVIVAGDASWQHRVYPNSLWTTPGGDYQLTPSALAGYGLVLEELFFASTTQLRGDVKSWVNNPATNHGWILLGNETPAYSARRVFARESVASAVPLLTVDYSIPMPTDNLALTEIATGLSRPVTIANAGDDSGRLFIVEQTGLIRIFDTATQTLLPSPYLNLSGLIVGGGSFSEQGLLGLAFHPDFASNRKFYVYYIRDPDPGADRSVLAMYQQNVGNPNIADTTATVIMEFTQDAANHNGGDLHFGADGYLYIASGDGGGANDSFNNSQNVNTLKGKILRIDVDSAAPGGAELCGLNPQYGIPPGNAFPGNGNGCDEILHLGLRNPWKFSFDAQTEEMYIGDVGQGKREEVDYAATGAAGLNFGWPCREGTLPFRGDVTCPNAIEPIFEYSSDTNTSECSITGGYVYRGAGSALAGYYVYGDYCSERIWLAKKESGVWGSLEWDAAASILTSLTAFGQDEQCELYVADLDAGKVFRIDDNEMIQRSGFEALRCQ